MLGSDSIVVGDPYKGRFQVLQKIGRGSFGDVFKGRNLLTKEEVAIKMEKIPARYPQLQYEMKVYNTLQGGAGIPTVRWFGETTDHKVLVMDLLGPNLESLFEKCGRKFSLKTVLMLSGQMIARLEFVHSRNLLHRDVKPDNFLMGRQSSTQKNSVFLIDFGHAKKYAEKTKGHIQYRDDKRPSVNGQLRYLSANVHRGAEQSRRDDLESLGYIFVYFLKGSLPWQGLGRAVTKKQRFERISEIKTTITVEGLCRDLPLEFAIYMKYVKGLNFKDEPDYFFLQSLFRKKFTALGFKHDFQYDWKNLK